MYPEMFRRRWTLTRRAFLQLSINAIEVILNKLLIELCTKNENKLTP